MVCLKPGVFKLELIQADVDQVWFVISDFEFMHVRPTPLPPTTIDSTQKGDFLIKSCLINYLTIIGADPEGLFFP
ncbi:hypothetical protein OPQ81_011004 [Rhizoctonia solani]|nr:hypothetical protein OPQ81_011004 [Rhizoctonia solani]